MHLSSITSVTAIMVVLAYLGIMGYMYVAQRSMVFPGAAADEEARAWIAQQPEILPWIVTMDDGVVLEGAIADRGHDTPFILYLSGNAEDALSFFPEATQNMPGMSLAALNYRGYGKSQGEPTQDDIKRDALAIYDALRKQIGDRPIIVFGRSLGTALAAHIAAQRPVSHVVMLTPFDSIAAVGQSHYPWLPVRFLLQHDFNVVPDARRIQSPTLFLIAEDDRTTPPPRAQALRQEWAGPCSSVVLAGARHNDVIDHPQYWPTLRAFLSDAS